MKITAVSVALWASTANAFSVVTTNEYHGLVPTVDVSSVALCGQDLWGCVGIASSSSGHRSCHAQITLGNSQDIGSPEQTWQFDQGMFRSEANPTKCLGVKSSYRMSELSLDSTSTYLVSLDSCDTDDAAQRWLLGDDDRVHSAANFDLCWTVNSDTQGVLLETEALMKLSPCTSDEDDLSHRQRMLLVGYGTTFMEPFVHSVQSDYGTEDEVRLAFWTNEDMSNSTVQTVQTLEIFKAQDMVGSQQDSRTIQEVSPIYTESVISHSNVIEIAASELLSFEDDGPVSFVARLGTAQSVAFTIHSDEEHIEPTHGSRSFLGASSSGPILPIVLGVAAVAIVAAFVALRLRHSAARNVASKASSTVPPPTIRTIGKPIAAEEDGKPNSAEEDVETVESNSVGGDTASH